MDTPDIDPPASRSIFSGPHTELNPELAKMLIFGLSLLLAVIVHAALTCYSIVPLSNGSAYKINRMTGKSWYARPGVREVAREQLPRNDAPAPVHSEISRDDAWLEIK